MVLLTLYPYVMVSLCMTESGTGAAVSRDLDEFEGGWEHHRGTQTSLTELLLAQYRLLVVERSSGITSWHSCDIPSR